MAKERLLNLAIKSVPANVDKIAWIDCDVIFERSDWVEEAKRQLNTFNIAQLYSDFVDLNSDDHQTNFNYRDAPLSGHGIVSLVNEYKFRTLDLTPLLENVSRSVTPGGAWAAKRAILEEHGLYDAMIVGSGDRVLVAASYGQFETIIKLFQLDSVRRQHYLKWARPFHEAVGERVGYVAGRLYHLWHGDVKNRRRSRHQMLAALAFDPNSDIEIGPNGAWQWARSRPELEEFLSNYFINRAEDEKTSVNKQIHAPGLGD